MEIRNYKSSDKEEVIEMVREILEGMFNGDPYQFLLLKEFNITKNYVAYIVLVVDGNIVATGALKKLNKNDVRLKRMYVRSEYQGRGFASKILNRLFDIAREMGFRRMLFHTYPVMENARRFHKRHGFVETEGEDPEQIHFVKEL